jgi:hypothetical protein
LSERACPQGEMACQPVSPRIGNVKNKNPSVIELVSAQ